MTKHCLIVLLFAAPSFASDQVNMKNGDIYKGDIVEQKFNQYLQIRFKDGNEKRLKWDEIEGIEKEDTQRAIATETPAPSTESAPQSHRAYVAAQLGVGLVNSASGGSFFLYGVRAGLGAPEHPSGLLSLGIFTSGFSQTVATGAVVVTDTIFTLGTEIITRKLYGSGAYLGGRIGFAIDNASIIGGGSVFTGSTTRLIVGPAVGYEIGVSDQTSLVLDIAWFTAGGGTLTMPGLGTFTYNPISAFTFQTGVVANF